MNKGCTKSMTQLMKQFGRLPGIGPRSAERLAYHVLKQPAEEALELARSIEQVKNQIRHCRRCYNLTEEELCGICRDPHRDGSILCVVEQPNDLLTLEETGTCKWVYHVLLGHLAPLDGITPDRLTIDALIKRISAENIREVVMATNPTMEGDGTVLYINSLLKNSDVEITRLARGLPTGGSIEYANKSILNDAINGRVKIQ